MRRNFIIVAAVAALTLGATGCSTMDAAYRGTARMLNPDSMTLMAGAKWMNDMPNLRAVSPDKHVVYVRFRNLSGADIPNLFNEIRDTFEQSGYRVTQNPDEAWYEVQTIVRYAGEGRMKEGQMGTLAGAVVGGVGGAVAGHAIGGNMTGSVLGAAAGAVLIGGALDIMANRNKMIEYDVVVDVRLGERVPGGVQTNRRTDERSDTGHSAAFNAAGGSYESGSSSTQSSEDQAYQMTDQFMYYKNTLTVWARRMGLQPDEALPVLSSRIVNSMEAVLP